MSRSLDLRNLLVEISNLDVYDPDSINTAMFLLIRHFNLHPDYAESTLNSLADYFRRNQFLSEVLISAVNRINHNYSNLELEYPIALKAFKNLGDKAIYGPAPMDVDDLISRLDNVSKAPDLIAMAPGITMDIIRQWLISMQPSSNNVGFIIKVMERFQKAFEYNPIRLAIVNKAFSLLTDHASRDSGLLGWLTFSLTHSPKIYKAGQTGSSLNDIIPEFDELCSRLDTIDKYAPDADASAMLSLAKWIHIHISKDITPAKILFNALSERYRDDQQMLIVLNYALKSLYELGAMTDDTGLLTLVSSTHTPIGPATTECETFAEQVEFWLIDKDIVSAQYLLNSWINLHLKLIKAHPELYTALISFLKNRFESNTEMSLALDSVLSLVDIDLKT